MYFGINNNIHLTFRQFLLLLTIIFIIFFLYHRLYLSNYCFPVEKYKELVKKYKSMSEKYKNKLTEYENLLNTQNSIINEYYNMSTNSNIMPEVINPETIKSNTIKSNTIKSNTKEINESFDDKLALPDPNHNIMQYNGPSNFDTFWKIS